MTDSTALALYGDRSLEIPEETSRRLNDYADAALAANTKRAYRSDWRDFTTWCELARRQPIPASAETLACYLEDLASRCKPATIDRRLTTIAEANRAAGFDIPRRDPRVRLVRKGIRNTLGTEQRQAAPTLTADIVRMCSLLPKTIAGCRDRALLLVGFAGAFRRSELVALDVEDLQSTAAGLIVTIRRSKTDQEGKGTTIGIPPGHHPETCPVTALRAWLRTAEIADGAVFRSVDRHGRIGRRLSDRAVGDVVKRAVAAAGLDPSRFSGHSLRAGLATQAAASGVSDHTIMRQTRHRSRSTLDKYVREGRLLRDNAAAAIGL